MFKEKYGIFFNFLGSWFCYMDFDEDPSEKNIIEEYKSLVPPDEVKKMIKDAQEVLEQINVYWKRLAHETNFYLKSEQEAASWLSEIIEYLKA